MLDAPGPALPHLCYSVLSCLLGQQLGHLVQQSSSGHTEMKSEVLNIDFKMSSTKCLYIETRKKDFFSSHLRAKPTEVGQIIS